MSVHETDEDQLRRRLGIQWNYNDIHRQNQHHVYLLGMVDADTREPRTPIDAAKGTAFAVSNQGHLLTAFHTIEAQYEDILAGKRLLAVSGVHGYGVKSEPAIQVEVLEAYPSSDFLLLKSPRQRDSHIKLVADHVPLGMWVATLGYPASYYDKDREKVDVGKRMVSAMVTAATVENDVHKIELDKHLANGHSGGPVFSMGGMAVAMAVSYKRAWHEVVEASIVGGKPVETRKMLFLPTQFSVASLVSNVADRLRRQGVPVQLAEGRFPEAKEKPRSA